jgi:hypothetical protein
MQFQRNPHRIEPSHSVMFLPGMAGHISDKPVFKPRKSPSKAVYETLKKFDSPATLARLCVKDFDADINLNPADDSPPSSPIAKAKKVVRIELPEQHRVPHKKQQQPRRQRHLFFTAPEDNTTTNAAAVQIQRVARGRVARTKTKIKLLEYKLATVENRKEEELQAINDHVADKKMAIRRKATLKQAKTVKKQLACAETANEGSKVIQFLRSENMKMRKLNEKLAVSIAELKEQNIRLEEATKLTLEHQGILETHFVKIQETHDALSSVVPKYEEKIAEMTEALDIRRQYCLSEHKMKIMYVKLVGTLAEMVEHHSHDKDLTEEVLGYCLELPSEDEGGKADSSEAGEEDYDEVSVGDEEVVEVVEEQAE